MVLTRRGLLLPRDLAVTLLGSDPKELKTYGPPKSRARMCTAALLMTDKTRGPEPPFGRRVCAHTAVHAHSGLSAHNTKEYTTKPGKDAKGLRERGQAAEATDCVSQRSDGLEKATLGGQHKDKRLPEVGAGPG